MKYIRLDTHAGFDYMTGFALAKDMEAIIAYAKKMNYVVANVQRRLYVKNVSNIENALNNAYVKCYNRIPHVCPLSVVSDVIVTKRNAQTLMLPENEAECEKLEKKTGFKLYELYGLLDSQTFLNAAINASNKGTAWKDYGIHLDVIVNNKIEKDAADFSGYNNLTRPAAKSLQYKNGYTAKTLDKEKNDVVEWLMNMNNDKESVLFDSVYANGEERKAKVSLSTLVDHMFTASFLGEKKESMYSVITENYKSSTARQNAVELMFRSWNQRLTRGIPSKNNRISFIEESTPVFMMLLQKENGNRMPYLNQKNVDKGAAVVKKMLAAINMDLLMRDFPSFGARDLKSYVNAMNYICIQQYIQKRNKREIYEEMRGMEEFDNKVARDLLNNLIAIADAENIVHASNASMSKKISNRLKGKVHA